MKTKIIKVTNDHFDWVMEGKGKHKKLVKRSLSKKKIAKLVKVTYDDKGNEVTREHYDAEAEGREILEKIKSMSPKNLKALKKILQL